MKPNWFKVIECKHNIREEREQKEESLGQINRQTKEQREREGGRKSRRRVYIYIYVREKERKRQRERARRHPATSTRCSSWDCIDPHHMYVYTFVTQLLFSFFVIKSFFCYIQSRAAFLKLFFHKTALKSHLKITLNSTVLC